MTIVTPLSICLAVVCAFLLGRLVVISTRRDKRNKALKAEVKKLNHRLDCIRDNDEPDTIMLDCYERWIEKYNQWRKENNI